MGLPNYPTDVGKSIRDIRRMAADAFTGSAAVSRDGRPWIPLTISTHSDKYTLWPSTTLNTFGPLQVAAGVRSHPKIYVQFSVFAPAAGCEVKIMCGADTLYGPTAYAAGLTSVSSTLTLPSSLTYYETFSVQIHVRSLTAGQTSYGSFVNVYGRS